jgi:hypothetical protein
MRTITAVALALSMLVGVTAANAATTHKKHHSKKHHASTASKGDKSKDKAPATK